MQELDELGLTELASLTLAFNSLVKADTDYLTTQSEDALNKSINLAAYIQDGCRKYDITIQQLADIAGYTPKAAL